MNIHDFSHEVENDLGSDAQRKHFSFSGNLTRIKDWLFSISVASSGVESETILFLHDLSVLFHKKDNRWWNVWQVVRKPSSTVCFFYGISLRVETRFALLDEEHLINETVVSLLAEALFPSANTGKRASASREALCLTLSCPKGSPCFKFFFFVLFIISLY